MLIELRCATHGGAREGAVLGNLNSEPNEDSGMQGVMVPVSSAKPAPIKVKNKNQKNQLDENRNHEKLLIVSFFSLSETGAIHFVGSQEPWS